MAQYSRCKSRFGAVWEGELPMNTLHLLFHRLILFAKIDCLVNNAAASLGTGLSVATHTECVWDTHAAHLHIHLDTTARRSFGMQA